MFDVDSKPPGDLNALAAAVKEIAGVKRTEVDLLPSGAAFLNVWSGSRLFVLFYSPNQRRYGVDESTEGDGIGNDYRFGYEDFTDARLKLLELLRAAGTDALPQAPAKTERMRA